MLGSFCFANLLSFRIQTYFKGRGACLYGYELGMLCIYTENPSLFKMLVARCPGFGWDRVNFLLSSWYSAVFWI